MKAKKPKLWSSAKADKEFSKFIRNRDGNKCVNCGRTVGVGNSHFWNRNISALRYDPRNCDTLCWLPCHFTWEKQKQGPYRDFKIKQLGQAEYDKMRKEAYSNSVTRVEAIKGCMKLLSTPPSLPHDKG